MNSDDDFADANEVVYYHANTLFTVCALSDSSGTVIERYRYDAYGGATVLDADWSGDGDGLSDVDNPYTFTGRRLDSESGLMQYRNRYYSPTLGRFISRDPLAYSDSYNVYAIAVHRPTFATDPSGRMASGLAGIWGVAVIEPTPFGEILALTITIVLWAWMAQEAAPAIPTTIARRQLRCEDMHPGWPHCTGSGITSPMAAAIHTALQLGGIPPDGWSGPLWAACFEPTLLGDPRRDGWYFRCDVTYYDPTGALKHWHMSIICEMCCVASMASHECHDHVSGGALPPWHR